MTKTAKTTKTANNDRYSKKKKIMRKGSHQKMTVYSKLPKLIKSNNDRFTHKCLEIIEWIGENLNISMLRYEAKTYIDTVKAYMMCSTTKLVIGGGDLFHETLKYNIPAVICNMGRVIGYNVKSEDGIKFIAKVNLLHHCEGDGGMISTHDYHTIVNKCVIVKVEDLTDFQKEVVIDLYTMQFAIYEEF